MTAIGAMPITQLIDYRRSRFTVPFYFQSDVLKALGMQDECEIPIDFETDWESVPIIRGTDKVSGGIHDYLSRKDSIPVATKKIAADVYMEFLIFRGTIWVRRQGKYQIVRIWPGYFHVKNVLDHI